MRTISQVIRSAIALNSAIVLSMLMASATSVLAQADQSDSEEAFRQAIAKCALTQCLLGGAPVLDASFTAEVTTVWYPPASSGKPTLRASARYYRDHAGRVRVEQGFVGHDRGPQRIFMTPDAYVRATYLLDPVARTISTPVPPSMAEMMVGSGGHHHFVLPLSMSRFIAFFQIPAANLDSSSTVGEESLGQRSMAGVQTTGTRFSTQLPAVVIGSGRGERWVSPELKLVVYSRSEDSVIGMFEYQLTKISRAEPSAELFELPIGYVVNPVEFPLTWEFPYADSLRKPGRVGN
jgi:hypothetical protein